MSLIDLIGQNAFLRKLYPEGIQELSINGLSTDFSRIYINIRTQEQPAIFIGKYGEWGKDYDTMEFKLIGNFVSFVQVSNWNISFNDVCDYEASIKDEEIYLNFFRDQEWKVELKMKTLTFQSIHTYLKEEEDYIPQ
jgi:hypothetical protein